MSDVVIIGGGHNGLAAAFYLARAGRKPLLLERRAEIGGGALTTELHPGFRCATLSHESMIHADIARDMDLARHGVRYAVPAAQVCAPALDGPSLVLYADVNRSIDSIRQLSAADADAYAGFRTALDRVGSVLAPLFSWPPPDIHDPSAGDLWRLLRAGRRFRALERRDSYRLLRWCPMPIADLMHEWFVSDLLCATMAAPGLSGTMLGPRSAGSALILLMRAAHQRLTGRVPSHVLGGPGALTQAMAAAAVAAGADIRIGTAVERILVQDDRVVGVVAGGREIAAPIVISAADPKTTFLDLLDPADLMPEFATKIRNYRASGTVAKVNLALSSLPAFRHPSGDGAALSGRIHIGPGLDYLERAFDCAKYGEFSAEPWLDITIPSLTDTQLAPPGAHVASVYVHYAPYRLRQQSWGESRDALFDTVMRTLEPYAPGIRALVIAAQVITPAELESEYGFRGGHIFHGELAMDQLFTMRPLLGFAKYGSPIRGLHLCGAGTHPGGFITGASGRLAATEVLRGPARRAAGPDSSGGST